MNTLSRISLRSSFRRPGRTFLTLLSVVIGVAAIVAVSISTRTASLAYKQMFSAVTGNAALEITGHGKDGFDESLVSAIEALKTAEGKPAVDVAVPMIYRPALLSIPGQRIKVYALGIDSEKDKKVRDFRLVQGKDLAGDDEMLMDESFAGSSGVKLNDEVKLIGGKRGLVRFRIVGFVSPQSAGALRYSGMVMIPFPIAQDVFGATDKVDRIQIVLPLDADLKQTQALVRSIVPEELKVDAPSVNSAIMQENQLSSEEALKLCGAFTVLLAVFIIFNTFLMNVGERKNQLSILRAIGSTRTNVVMMIMRESLALGFIGSLIGMVVGYLGALILHAATTALLQSPLPSPPFSLQPFLLGLTVGIIISFVAAAIPALLAAMVTPLEGMRSVVQSRSNGVIPWIVAAGVVMMVVSVPMLYFSIQGNLSIDFASPAGIIMIFGVVLLTPLATEPLAHFAAALIRWFAPLEANLALKQLLRHHLRTSLTMGVLIVAGCTGVGMASSVLDAIDDVRNWSRVAIVGDFFLRASMPDMTTGLAPDLPAEVGTELKKLQHIKRIDTVSFVQANIGEQAAIVIARNYQTNEEPAFDLVDGDLRTLGGELVAGDTVIGSVIAERLGAKVGDEIPLAAKDGVVKLKVAGIANDYFSGGLSVHLDRPIAEKLLGISGVDGYILHVDRNHSQDLIPPLQKICGDHGATLHSNADIQNMILGMVRGINGCLLALVWLGYVIASFGVVNTLTMNVLEQTREIGLLRITGMTREQVRTTIIMQALIMGLIGATPGIFLGLGTAWLMNLAMAPSLGHPIDFQWHPWIMFFSWVGSMAIVLVAAYFPAVRAARVNVVTALHYE